MVHSWVHRRADLSPAADIKKVSHNVKDLMRTLLENGLNADGFMFDTALAAYLVDATSGKYEIGQLFAGYFHTELVKPVHLEPDAFSLLGDVTAAEAAFHSYTSAVDALYGVLAPKLKELDLWDLYATAELPLCRVLAENPAKLYGMFPRKGVLQDGADADIVVYDPQADHVLRAEDMASLAGYSPYEGFAIRGGIHQVWLRGRLAVEDGFVLAGPDGKYIPRGKCSL